MPSCPFRAGVTIAAAVHGLANGHHGLLELLQGRAHGTHIVGIQRSLDRRRLFGDLAADLLGHLVALLAQQLFRLIVGAVGVVADLDLLAPAAHPRRRAPRRP